MKLYLNIRHPLDEKDFSILSLEGNMKCIQSIRQSGELYLQILPLEEARVYSKVVGAQKCKCSLYAPPVKSNISSNFSFLVASVE